MSPGALPSDAEALGILEQDRNKMFAEAIDVILAIWERDPPYDIDFPDNRFKVSTARTQALEIGVGYIGKPYQKPRPEIVGTVVAPFSPGVVLMGKRDFHPLSANFLLSKHLKSHWENYCKGKAEVGVKPDVKDWRVARTICVADDDKTAERYGRTGRDNPYEFYWSQMLFKMKRGKRTYVFKSHKDQPDDEITLDYVMDNCVIHGSVNKVVDQLLALAGGDRRFRRDRLCRDGLGRSGAGETLDAADGRAGSAAGQRGDREVCSRLNGRTRRQHGWDVSARPALARALLLPHRRRRHRHTRPARPANTDRIEIQYAAPKSPEHRQVLELVKEQRMLEKIKATAQSDPPAAKTSDQDSRVATAYRTPGYDERSR